MAETMGRQMTKKELYFCFTDGFLAERCGRVTIDVVTHCGVYSPQGKAILEELRLGLDEVNDLPLGADCAVRIAQVARKRADKVCSIAGFWIRLEVTA